MIKALWGPYTAGFSDNTDGTVLWGETICPIDSDFTSCLYSNTEMLAWKSLQTAEYPLYTLEV